jgi:hypothetical protein
MFISLCLCLFAESFHSTVLPNNRIFGTMLLVYLEEDNKCLIKMKKPTTEKGTVVVKQKGSEAYQQRTDLRRGCVFDGKDNLVRTGE